MNETDLIKIIMKDIILSNIDFIKIGEKYKSMTGKNLSFSEENIEYVYYKLMLILNNIG
jgi:hypothetical protein